MIHQLAAPLRMLWRLAVFSSMLQSSLTVGAQELSPVVCFLHSFPTSSNGWSACCWPSCHLFTDGLHELGSLLLPPSLVHFQQPPPPPLCASFQFCCLLFSFFFFAWGITLSRGVVLVYPRGGWGIPCDAWSSTVWSAKCLPSTFGASG
jgi:hypothetical protein